MIEQLEVTNCTKGQDLIDALNKYRDLDIFTLGAGWDGVPNGYAWILIDGERKPIKYEEKI